MFTNIIAGLAVADIEKIMQDFQINHAESSQQSSIVRPISVILRASDAECTDHYTLIKSTCRIQKILSIGNRCAYKCCNGSSVEIYK
ncbi:hypothetical protein NPIL_499561 [Nephila pilipes]|uniref:Uncharacterized protein n=1 Tax=Nephila pilipes TaxID=299642 RepID=A0A8X6NA21_NEPPI|nr:hypothetical protein NPIL_499561 [Nephila pilipes]